MYQGLENSRQNFAPTMTRQHDTRRHLYRPFRQRTWLDLDCFQEKLWVDMENYRQTAEFARKIVAPMSEGRTKEEVSSDEASGAADCLFHSCAPWGTPLPLLFQV